MSHDHWVTVPLGEHFNLDGVATADDPARSSLDGHFALFADALPAAGRVVLRDVPFTFPDVRSPGYHCVVPDDQRIEVPVAHYAGLFALGTSVLGSSRAGVELHFADGSKDRAELEFTDWCHLPQYGELEALRLDYRLHAGGWAAPANSLWMQVALVPPDDELCALVLRSAENARIFALTLAPPPLPRHAAPALPALLRHAARAAEGHGWSDTESVRRFQLVHAETAELVELRGGEELAQVLRELQRSVLERLPAPEALHARETDVIEALRVAEPALEELRARAGRAAAAGERGPLRYTLVGHSHLDAVWLWPWNKTVQKVERTFAANLSRMERFPRFTFAQSSPLFYHWIRQHHGDALHEEIARRVAEGRWELVGGAWVEPDGTLPGGESLVRQRLVGQRAFLALFGRTSEVCWLPDTFGLHASWPQIIRKTGGRYFFTTKLAWNRDNEFPYQHFLWEGIDGSRVLALQSAVGCGAAPGPDRSVADSVAQRNRLLRPGERAVVDSATPRVPAELLSEEYVREVLVIYGEGDGGEGPSDKMVQRAHALEELEEYTNGSVHDHFRRVEAEYADRLPVWRDELYLENHRGTFTSQGRIKELCRRGEERLLRAELWATVASLLGGPPAPREGLAHAWRTLLFQQFHDILPGTSIPQAYVDAELDFAVLDRRCRQLEEAAIEALASRIPTRVTCPPSSDARPGTGRALLLFNALSWPREHAIEIPWGTPRVEVTDVQLREVRSQVIWRDGAYRLLLAPALPACGYGQLRLFAPAGSAAGVANGTARARQQVAPTTDLDAPRATPDGLENSYLRLRVDGEGRVVSLFDRERQRELLAASGIRLRYFHNHPAEWNNWNIDPEYERNELAVEGTARTEVLDDGPLLAALAVDTQAPEGGSARLEFRVYRDEPRVDIIVDLDVRSRESLIKLELPLEVGAESAVHDIPFGEMTRPLTPRSEFERAKWELAAQSWVDVSGPEHGVTVVLPDRTGFDLRHGFPRLSLVKGGIDPDPDTDVGRHRIRVSLILHAEDHVAARAWCRAAEARSPVLHRLEREHDGDLAPAGSLVRLQDESGDATSVTLEALKPAEDEEESVVARVVRRAPGGGEVSMDFERHLELRAAEEIDFLELERGEERARSGRVALPLERFEVKAIRMDIRVSGVPYTAQE